MDNGESAQQLQNYDMMTKMCEFVIIFMIYFQAKGKELEVSKT